MKRFLELKKTKKNSQKYKTTELVQIYCQNFNKIIAIRISSISLHFSAFSINFFLMDPDQHIESGSRRKNYCGSTAHSTQTDKN